MCVCVTDCKVRRTQQVVAAAAAAAFADAQFVRDFCPRDAMLARY